MYNLLVDFDPAVLKPKIADDPGVYTRLLGSLCKLTDGSLRFERRRQEEAQNLAISRALENTIA